MNKRSNWHADTSRDLGTGDLLWMVDLSSPRGRYPLGRVTALHYGTNKVFARFATVKTLSGQLVRPLVKFAPDLASSRGEDVAEQIVN